SDLYITAGSAPVFRVSGVGHAGRAALDAERIAAMARSLMTDEQAMEFDRALEMNLALAMDGGGRFRANLFRQRGAVGMVFRLVRTEIKTLEQLKLPPTLADIMHSKRGLVLLVGATGSGKSTTLAAMIDHRNRAETG